MIYPASYEQKIGFRQIKKHISQLCISTIGQHFVEKIHFSSNIVAIKKLLDQSSEFVDLLAIGKAFPTNDFIDLREDIQQLKTPGSFIEQEVLFNLVASLFTLQEILNYFNETDKEAFPELKKLVDLVYLPEELLHEAQKIIDKKGEIRDSASDKLKTIRQSITSKQRKAFRETKKAFEKAKKSGWIPDNTEITIRNGRSVIPLKAANKRSIGGIIHDESSTGQTVFVEASMSFEINNEIKELESEERREITKILLSFTDNLRPNISDLIDAYRFLGLIDFIRAKALFSIKIAAKQPIITNNKPVGIREAFHPLLFLSHKEQKKTVIPLDLELTDENRILIISGPNAGGKSICLKTVGILQYMLQCGILVSASPDSVFRLFDNIFIDIGDEQSIENDLSTYSSHLLNMKYFLRNANNRTLVLIDEFGTGTEPQLGGSIAEATLEQLNNRLTFGLITTHYTNLKVAAERMNGLVNGAMLFDSKEMQPMYKLQIGKPGSSFAFEIAKKIGFPANVLNKAKKKSGGKHVRFDQQLQQMEIDKIKISKQQEKANAADAYLSRMIEKYTDLINNLEKSKKQLIKDANEKALLIIEESNKAVEKTIRDIKEAGADKVKTREIRKELYTKKDELKDVPKQASAIKKAVNKKTKVSLAKPEAIQELQIKANDYVKIRDTDIVGEVINIDGNVALLNVNDIKLKITVSKLVKSKAPKQRPAKRKGHSFNVDDINKKAVNFKLTLDLRGKRADEALLMLKKYIDEAILLNMREVSILHGKGYGILRDIIRQYLQNLEEIKNFGDAPIEMGGTGITRVNLK
ncbi:MAG: endonuclease MutS2 [Bacteroidetes bacterium]|nr:endonuclease MutS2 [Bacteroidota bacterium]